MAERFCNLIEVAVLHWLHWTLWLSASDPPAMSERKPQRQSNPMNLAPNLDLQGLGPITPPMHRWHRPQVQEGGQQFTKRRGEAIDFEDSALDAMAMLQKLCHHSGHVVTVAHLCSTSHGVLLSTLSRSKARSLPVLTTDIKL